MERIPGEQELRIRQSLQKLDLPEWYKKSSRERLPVVSPKSNSPRWTDVRQRSTSASSLGLRSGSDWSASSSFKRPQPHVTGSVSACASGRQSKESLLQSPMSPSSVGTPWSSASSYYYNRPHSAFNYYSHNAGYSSASVSRCSSSRSTSPTASINLGNAIRSPYKQPYLGWRSSEKLARELSNTHEVPTTPTTSCGYFYRSPAERLSKGPGYYAMKFGMFQHHKPGGNYVRQMVEEIEKITRQQQQQTQKHPEITVNVIGPSPNELTSSPCSDEETGTQVEEMVRQLDRLINQNGEDVAEDGGKMPAGVIKPVAIGKSPDENNEPSPSQTPSEKARRFVWMESSFVGVKPTSNDVEHSAEDQKPVEEAVPIEAQPVPAPPPAQMEVTERKLSLSTTTLDEVLDSLLALPSTSSKRNSPMVECTVEDFPKKSSWACEIPVPSAPPLEEEECESEVSSGSSIDGDETRSNTSNTTNTSSSGGGGSKSSECSSASRSVSSVSNTAATTVCNSSSTGCSDTSCNQESRCSSHSLDKQQEASSPPSESATVAQNTTSVSQSNDETSGREEISEGFPPPPSAVELQQLLTCGGEEEQNVVTEQVIRADEQPLSGVVRSREWRVGSRRSLRPDYLDDSSPVHCSREQCDKSTEMREARHQFKSCHNCNNTFYCSRTCRKEDWSRHSLVCVYGRVRSLCKQALQYSRENEAVLQYLSKIARTGLLTQGQGFVKLLFRNTEMAVRFLREGWPRLEDGPIYVGWRNFMPEEMGDEVYRVVIQLCQNYDPQLKFVLVVAVFVTREVPIRSVPHWEREIIAKCAKISLAKSSGQDYINNTLVLTGPNDMGTRGMSESECRAECLASIEHRLRDRGVNLRLQFPDVYHRLCSYVENNEPFPPITIYPKDGLTGQTFMCVIMPHTNSNNDTSQ